MPVGAAFAPALHVLGIALGQRETVQGAAIMNTCVTFGMEKAASACGSTA